MSKAVDLAQDGKTLWVYTRHYENVERVIVRQGKKPIKIFEPWKERPRRTERNRNYDFNRGFLAGKKASKYSEMKEGKKCRFCTPCGLCEIRSQSVGFQVRCEFAKEGGER